MAQPQVGPQVSVDNLINISDFGGLADQGMSLDTTVPFNAALQFAKQNKLRAIYFGRGSYTFTTRPQQIDFPITIVGDGKDRTALCRGYVEDAESNGLLTFLAGAAGSSVRDLGILASNGSAHGSAISLIADATNAPDYCLFSNLYLSAHSGATWDVTVYLNGDARQGNPIGVRDIDFQNCSVFGAASAAILLEGAQAFNFIGGGIFQAGGVKGTSGKLSISPGYDGDPTVALPCNYVNILTTFVDGILMQGSQHGHFSAYFSSPITTSSNSVDNIVIGHVDGGVQPYWQQSKYIDPES
jgi:hypothetical protein